MEHDTQDNTGDLMDMLTDADVQPDMDTAAIEAAKQRTYARVMERTTSPTPPRSWQPIALAGGGVAIVAVLGVVAGAMVLNSGSNGSGDPSAPPVATNPDAAGGGMSASCIGYSAEELRLRHFAFAGTLSAIEDGTVTFDVDEVYAGEPGSSITLDADTTLMNPMYTEFELEIGTRYLVSGDDIFAWGCGFTRPYTDELAAEWASILS